ncbi:hypothetical protein [Amycolatopsis australiensis]|uniref:hypothetical protein n=1 Tax=Amycolatopsis australiensis TaxID=546364 RepID=UPI0015A5AEB3|nr:hypothetical protein [Amycolatopsis australiensis]
MSWTSSVALAPRGGETERRLITGGLRCSVRDHDTGHDADHGEASGARNEQ